MRTAKVSRSLKNYFLIFFAFATLGCEKVATTSAAESGEEAPPPPPPDLSSYTANESDSNFLNIPFEETQNESFSLEFDTQVSDSSVDAVIGLSKQGPSTSNISTGFSSLAASVRFSPSGIIDSYNTSAYASETALNYTHEKTFRITIDVDVGAKRYSVRILPQGASDPIVIANNYSYRSTQSSTTVFNDISLVAVKGSITISNLTIKKLTTGGGSGGGGTTVGGEDGEITTPEIPELPPAVVARQPAREASFGPNGSHWPGQVSGLITPYMYDDSVPHRIEVNPSWSEITAALNALTSTQVSEGVLILVKPGILAGDGGCNSGCDVVLDNVGSKSWSRRVTIAPRDGYGTVTITNGLKVSRIKNICLAGFIIDGKLRILASTRFAFARVLVKGAIVVAADSTLESEADKWEFVEMVKRDAYSDPTDPMQVQSNITTNGVVLDGVYLAPNYLVEGHSAHQDTIQFLALGDAMHSGATIQDTAIFMSNRAATNGGLKDSVFRHSFISARAEYQENRFPIPAGHYIRSGGANQGAVRNITFDGGYVLGKLQSNQGNDDRPYRTVLNGATIDVAPGGYAAPVNGEWVVDPSILNLPLPTHPTDSYLLSIWR